MRINRTIFFFVLNIICFSCSNNFLEHEFKSTLFSDVNNPTFDSIQIENIYMNDKTYCLDFKFVGLHKRNYTLNWKCRNDSLIIITKKKDFFFLKLANNYEDDDKIEPLKIDYPNEFYPFGNYVDKVIFNNTTCSFDFSRYGSATMSVDPFISSIEIDNKDGVLKLEYFNGNDLEIYKSR
jgi:hypothetical protein